MNSLDLLMESVTQDVMELSSGLAKHAADVALDKHGANSHIEHEASKMSLNHPWRGRAHDYPNAQGFTKSQLENIETDARKRSRRIYRQYMKFNRYAHNSLD